jgi:anthranilate synthase/aminodeoxychorismate synthase-like glutamine amidotransferase
MILIIDNLDSFTYNLYQYFGELGEDVKVYRNNQISLKQIEELKPKAIVLSPGPGRPENSGICVDAIKKFYKEIPILGICLGHQAIGYSFGAKISQAERIKHGKTSFIKSCGELFNDMDDKFEAMRYHSLKIEQYSLPHELKCIATSIDDNEIMAIQHNKYLVFGLQFHPESIGTPNGKQILKNFLRIVGRKEDEKHITSTM